jgi:hypothetical protein
MAVRTIREELINEQGHEYYHHETRGLLKFMPRNAQSVWVIFGMFGRTGTGSLLYTMDSDGDHYLDDLNALKQGNLDIADRLVV